MSLTLYSPQGHRRSAKVQVVAQYLKIPLSYHRIDFSEFKNPEYLKLHPLGKIPLFTTPQGPIYESNTLMRYLARKANCLYGKSPFETAQIDQWLDYLYDQIQHIMYAMVGQIFGWSPLDRVQYATMENGLLRVMAVLHEHLQGRKYFVGEEISIADLGIAVMLSLLFKLVLDEEMRQRYSNVTEWYKRISSLPAFETVLGKTWLCEKKYQLNFNKTKQEN